MLTEDRDPQRSQEWISAAEAVASRWQVERATGGSPDDGSDVQPAMRDGLRDAGLRSFVLGALDAVLRPQSMAAAAAGARVAAPEVSAELPWSVRALVRATGAFAPILPAAVIPATRRALRSITNSVVADATPARLDALLARLTAEGRRAVLVPVAALPIGDEQAKARRADLTRWLAHPQADAVQIRARALIGPRARWAFDDVVDEILTAVDEIVHPGDARLILEITDIDDLELTIAVLARLVEDGAPVRFGIVLPLAFGEVAAAVPRVLALAQHAEMPLRIVLEGSVDAAGDAARASVHGWERAATTDAVDRAAALIRALRSVQETSADSCEIVVSDADPARLALAATHTAAADGPGVPLIQVPLVDHGELATHSPDLPVALVRVPLATPGADDAALAAVVRQQLSNDTDSTLPAQAVIASAFAAASSDPPIIKRAPDRTDTPEVRPDTRITRDPSVGQDALTQEVMGIARASIVTETSPIAPEAADLLFGGVPFVETAVFHDRETGAGMRAIGGFRAAADTDPSTGENRAWVRGILGRIPEVTGTEPGRVDHGDDVADRIATVERAAQDWATIPGVERAAVLRRLALEIETDRATLIEIAAADTEALPVDTDEDVTTAVDSFTYAASLAGELDALSGAVFVPHRVTVVEVPVIGALADLADGLATALAAGSGAVLFPMPQAEALADVLCAAAARAGVPDGLVTVAYADDPDPLAQDGVNQLIVSGDAARIAAVRSAHPTLAISARADGANTAIITASADFDRAAEDIVRAAFARAGRGSAATTTVIVLGAAGQSRRFSALLADVARTWRPGFAEDPRAQFGATSDDERTLWALTELSEGESWLVQPHQTPDGLWSGGIRIGLQPGSTFLQGRVDAPVIGVVAASMLSEAVRWQNAADAVHASLYTRSARDLGYWLKEINAGSLTVNGVGRAGRAGRRPVPAWNTPSVGSIAAPFGPNRLLGMGSWRASRGGSGSSTLHLRGLDSRITAVIEAAQPDLDFAGFDALRRGALSDAVAWDRDFGRVWDATGLRVERNLLRYRRVPVALRAEADVPIADVLRVVVAGVRARSDMTLSMPAGLPASVRHELGEQGIAVFMETAEEWVARVQASSVSRVRVLGAESMALASVFAASDRRIDAFTNEPTTAGRIELLPFLREQAITVAAERDGIDDRWSDAII